jgi:hypothetical protein
MDTIDECHASEMSDRDLAIFLSWSGIGGTKKEIETVVNEILHRFITANIK